MILAATRDPAEAARFRAATRDPAEALRLTEAYYRNGPAETCHHCTSWRSVYCNVDGFSYCFDHYPVGLL